MELPPSHPTFAGSPASMDLGGGGGAELHHSGPPRGQRQACFTSRQRQTCAGLSPPYPPVTLSKQVPKLERKMKRRIAAPLGDSRRDSSSPLARLQS